MQDSSKASRFERFCGFWPHTISGFQRQMGALLPPICVGLVVDTCRNPVPLPVNWREGWGTEITYETCVVFRMFESDVLTNRWVFRTPSKEKRTVASAEGSSGDIWVRSVGVLRHRKVRKTGSTLGMPQIPSSTHTWFLHEPLKQREKDGRERRRRERKNFGGTCVSLTQQCLLVLLSSQKVRNTGSILRMLLSYSLTHTRVLREPPKQRERMIASAEGASEET